MTLDEFPDDEDVLEAEHEPVAEELRMCLAEAGYPDADVWWGGTGLFCDDVPDDVWDRACALVNRAATDG